MPLDAASATYLDVVHQLLAEDERHANELDGARQAGQAQVTDALAAQRRANDQMRALRDRVRRLDGQVNRSVMRAGSPEVTNEVRAELPPQPLGSVTDVSRAVEAMEKDLHTLQSALDWLDRNPVAPRSAAPQALPAASAPLAAPAAQVPSPAPSASAGPSGSARTWVGLIVLIIALAFVGFLLL